MKYVLLALITTSSLLLLSACNKTVLSEATTATNEDHQLSVTAELMYRERMLAPEGSTLIATIRDVSIADQKATIMSEEIIGLGQGIQLPLKVTLKVAQDKLAANKSYAFSARLEDPKGKLLWLTTEHHALSIDTKFVDLGQVMMQRVQSGTVNAKAHPIYPIPFKAHGNEPGWLVDIQPKTIKIQTNYGQNTLTLPRPKPQPYKGGYKYHAQHQGRIAIIDIRRKLCYDNMSGRPYPNHTSLTLDGEVFEGCGGEPEELLVNHEWVVEDIAKQGIIDNSRITMNFTEDGRIHGISSCNNYSAAYELTGENLTFKAPMGTLKACAPALMNQEQKFLDLLSKITRYDIDAYGALVLTTKDGKTITARH